MSIHDQAKGTSFSASTLVAGPSPRHHGILPRLRSEDFDRAGKLGINFSVALEALWANRLRSLLTTLVAITLTSLLGPFAVSAGVGVIFGLYPAMRAAQLDPIEALRSL